MQECTDESMMAAGFTICQCFRGFMGTVDVKEEVLVWHFIIKSVDLLLFLEGIW